MVAHPIAHTDRRRCRGSWDVVAPGATVPVPAYAEESWGSMSGVCEQCGEFLVDARYMGTYHWMSAKHLHRYVTEFAGRANVRDFDTLTQMKLLAFGMVGKRLRYQDLVEE